MKIKTQIYLLLFSLFLLNSASQSPSIENSVVGKWTRTSQTISPARNGVSDMLAADPDCVKDNYLELEANGKYSFNEGKTKCKPEDPQVPDAGTWTLSGDKKTLSIKKGERSTSWTILELTENTIAVSETFTENGVSYTILTKAKRL